MSQRSVPHEGPASPAPATHVAEVERDQAQFSARFARVATAALALLAAVGGACGVLGAWMPLTLTGTLGVLIFGAAHLLTYRGSGLWGRRLCVHGLLLIGVIGVTLDNAPGQLPALLGMATILTTLAGFLLGRADMAIVAAAGLGVVLFDRTREARASDPRALAFEIVATGLLVLHVVLIGLFTRSSHEGRRKLVRRVAEMDRTAEHASRVARGDLTGTVEGDGALSEAVRAMLQGLRSLVSRTHEVAAALSSAMQQIAAMAVRQEQGAVEQASAVGQVQRAMAALLDASNSAARSIEEVFRYVEKTQWTTEVVAERARALASHTDRIHALLETIQDIARKSEILALNAALEGARAGEAGRGFSLVAAHMQRLAESVTGSAHDARALVEDIRSATAATLTATEESTRLSANATIAVGKISFTFQEQHRSAAHVASAMKDIHDVTVHASASSQQSLAATRELSRLAGELTSAVEGFRL